MHHGMQYQVMTNSPSYDQQLALNAYWESLGGLTFLPGINRAADRFARAFLDRLVHSKYFVFLSTSTSSALPCLPSVPCNSGGILVDLMICCFKKINRRSQL